MESTSSIVRTLQVSDEVWALAKTAALRRRMGLRNWVEEALRGAEKHEQLFGLPEAIGTSEDFPVTTRPEYLGISREVVSAAKPTARIPNPESQNPAGTGLCRTCEHPAGQHRDRPGGCLAKGCGCHEFKKGNG